MEFDPEKGTKEHIADAYETAMSAIKERTSLLETPATIAARENKAATEKRAEELLKLGILSEAIVREYEELKGNIEEKKVALEKLYGISIAPDSLEAVREADTILKEYFDTEDKRCEEEHALALETQAEEAKSKRTELESQTEDKVSELAYQLEELSAESKQSLERELAEYEYQQKRERKLAEEKRTAEVAEREEKLHVREQAAEENRTSIQMRMDEIAALQTAVDSIPAQLLAARQEGAKKADKRLSKEHGYATALERKDQDNKIAALQGQYDRLLEKYNRLIQEKESISERLAQCNADSRALTSDTVRSIGGINILNPDQRSHPETGRK